MGDRERAVGDEAEVERAGRSYNCLASAKAPGASDPMPESDLFYGSVRMRFVVEAGGREQTVRYGGPTDGSPQSLPGWHFGTYRPAV
jgi:hypothetical protein